MTRFNVATKTLFLTYSQLTENGRRAFFDRADAHFEFITHTLRRPAVYRLSRESHEDGVFMRTASSLGRRLYVYDRNENSTLGNLTRIFSRYGQVIDELGTIRERMVTSSTNTATLHCNLVHLRDVTTQSGIKLSLLQLKRNFTTMSVDWLLDILFFIRQHSTDMRRSTSPSPERNTAARALMTLATTDYDNGYETELLEAVAQATDDDL